MRVEHIGDGEPRTLDARDVHEPGALGEDLRLPREMVVEAVMHQSEDFGCVHRINRRQRLALRAQ